MTVEELRVAALTQAASDQKHKDFGTGGGMMFIGTGAPPDTALVVTRAEAYLKFLMGEKQLRKARK